MTADSQYLNCWLSLGNRLTLDGLVPIVPRAISLCLPKTPAILGA